MERYGEPLWQLRKRKKRMIVPETAEDAACHGEMRVGDARKKGRSDSWKRFFEKFRKNKNKNKNKNKSKGDYTKPKYKQQLQQQDSRPQLQVEPTIEPIESPICHVAESKVRAEPAKLYRTIDPVQTRSPTRTSHHYPPTEASTSGEKVMKYFNPSKGLSILTLALGAMLLSGRACAILCICAWFYLSRCFTSNTMAQKTTSNKCDEEIDTE